MIKKRIFCIAYKPDIRSFKFNDEEFEAYNADVVVEKDVDRKSKHGFEIEYNTDVSEVRILHVGKIAVKCDDNYYIINISDRAFMQMLNHGKFNCGIATYDMIFVIDGSRPFPVPSNIMFEEVVKPNTVNISLKKLKVGMRLKTATLDLVYLGVMHYENEDFHVYANNKYNSTYDAKISSNDNTLFGRYYPTATRKFTTKKCIEVIEDYYTEEKCKYYLSQLKVDCVWKI